MAPKSMARVSVWTPYLAAISAAAVASLDCVREMSRMLRPRGGKRERRRGRGEDVKGERVEGGERLKKKKRAR